MPKKTPNIKVMSVAVLWALSAGWAVPGCGKKSGTESKKGPSFKPGKMVPYENRDIGFSLTIPDNLQKKVEKDTVTFHAGGFPKVTVRLEKTKDSSTRGSGGSSGTGRVKWKVYAPMRKLTCHCQDAGDFEETVKKICKSLKNTKEAAKNLNVKFDPVKITGELKNKDAYLTGMAALKPKIVQCWKDAVTRDAKFPRGDLNFDVTFNADGSRKGTNISRTFNYQKHQPLTECVEKQFFTVKPEPKSGTVEVKWYIRFNLY